MNIYEFISLLIAIPFIIFLEIKLEKYWYKSAVSHNLRNLYTAKRYYDNLGKIDSSIVLMVLGCDLCYHYIYKDKDLLKFINKVLVKVGRQPI